MDDLKKTVKYLSESTDCLISAIEVGGNAVESEIEVMEKVEYQ